MVKRIEERGLAVASRAQGIMIRADHLSAMAERFPNRQNPAMVERWTEQHLAIAVELNELTVRDLAKVVNPSTE
jgi:hypothetical protein